MASSIYSPTGPEEESLVGSLDADGMVRLVEGARELYLARGVEKDSATTLAVLILFDNLRNDVHRNKSLEPTTFISRSDLAQGVTDQTSLAFDQKTLDGLAESIKNSLRKFHPIVVVAGGQYKTTILGPAPKLRKKTADDEGLAFEVEFEFVGVAVRRESDERSVAATAPVAATEIPALRLDNIVFPDLRGICICCPSVTAFNIGDRYCHARNCHGRYYPINDEDRELFVTIVPERKMDYSTLAKETRDSIVQFAGEQPAGRLSDLSPYLPYHHDTLQEMGLSLGRPTVYRSKRLEDWSLFSEVHVLDLSTFPWSGTLKDPKNWAVMNCAIEQDVSVLGLYTAGNAGISLAKMAYGAGRLLGRRFRIFALVDDTVGDDIRNLLRVWDSTVIEDDNRKYILDPVDFWRRVHPHLESNEERRWQVTDGLDGVSIIMYRLIFIEVLRRVRPSYIVVPLGTGNLYVGAHLATCDVFAEEERPKIFTAVPDAENVTRYFDSFREPKEPPTSGKHAIMPKLVGRYTPLLPALAFLHNSSQARSITVSHAMQSNVAQALWQQIRQNEPTTAAEPSALAAAAALCGDGKFEGLRELIRPPDRYQQFHSDQPVLVVNSGFGILGESEREFLASVLSVKKTDRLYS
jgi:hypothetical protein